MDKLSDQLKEIINSANINDDGSRQSAKRLSRINTFKDLLPEIEKLEQEKEELIKITIKKCLEYCTSYGCEYDSACHVCENLNDIKKIEKLTGKSWDQITKEQE